MKRVSVVGVSGSGKTTVAEKLARRLAAPHLELDSIFHQPGWEPLPEQEFRARVAEFVTGDRWVVDGNYSAVEDLVWQRADTVVWLDPPRYQVMRRIIRRTLRRVISQAELWNGNRESWGNLLQVDPGKSIIAWAWTRHPVVRARYAGAQADPANARLTFVRLRSVGDVAALIARAGEPEGPAAPAGPAGSPGGALTGRGAVSWPRSPAGPPARGRRGRPC